MTLPHSRAVINSERASNDMEIVPVTASQADEMLRSQASIGGLQAHIDGLRSMGQLRSVQLIETELKKERRRQKAFAQESPAVADAFFRLRRAEDAETLAKQRAIADENKRKRDAAATVADRDEAKAELQRDKRQLLAMENVRASRHAIKSFTVEVLGAGRATARGAKGKKHRFEVLDRLALLNVGLSAAQKNDWAWFKDAWGQHMVSLHGEQ